MNDVQGVWGMFPPKEVPATVIGQDDPVRSSSECEDNLSD